MIPTTVKSRWRAVVVAVVVVVVVVAVVDGFFSLSSIASLVDEGGREAVGFGPFSSGTSRRCRWRSFGFVGGRRFSFGFSLSLASFDLDFVCW